MVFWSVRLGSSVTMNVDPELRDVTLVWTLKLPNSVMRQVGICSVKARSPSGGGLSSIFFARTSISSRIKEGEAILAIPAARDRYSKERSWARRRARWASGRRLPALLDREVETD